MSNEVEIESRASPTSFTPAFPQAGGEIDLMVYHRRIGGERSYRESVGYTKDINNGRDIHTLSNRLNSGRRTHRGNGGEESGG